MADTTKPNPQIDALVAALKNLTDQLKASQPKKKAAKGGGKGGGGPTGGPPGGKAAGAAEEGGGAAGAAGAAAGAIGAVVAAISAAKEAITSWVEALQPALIEQFNRVVKDLQATLGQAFTGVFELAIGYIQDVASAVAPFIEQLKPIVDELAHTLFRDLAAQLQTASQILQLFIPLIQVIVQIFEILFDVVRLVAVLIEAALLPVILIISVYLALLSESLKPAVAILNEITVGFEDLLSTITTIGKVFTDAIIEFLKPLLGIEGLGDIIQEIKDAFKDLILSIVEAVVQFALLIGATDFVKKLKAAFTPGTGAVAAGPTAIKGLEQIGKDLAQASVNAAGGGGSEAEKIGKDIIKAIDDASTSANAFLGPMKTALELLSAVQKAAGKVVEAGEKFLDRPLGYTADSISSGVSDTYDAAASGTRLGRFLTGRKKSD